MSSEPIPCFFDLTPEQLQATLQSLALPAYRAAQVMDWVYRKHQADPARMSNLSKAERTLLAENLAFTCGQVVAHQQASDGTQKLLIRWGDRAIGDKGGKSDERSTECVMIPAESQEHARRTACVSSQVGCPVGCRFCASGLGGLQGNLTAGQIVEQVWRLSTLAGVQRISHVVFMGMGEPLANFDPVVRAIQTLTAEWGLGISARRITVSTVGLPSQIRRLAQIDLPVTLAISLHAPNDEVRKQIIPWAEFVSIGQILEAARDYFDRTGREITLEYILLHQVNDRIEHARELAKVARTLRSNVNLIRYNEVSPLPFGRPDDGDVHAFQETLRRAGVNVHIRASRGRDIAAACGQLRHQARGQAPGSL